MVIAIVFGIGLRISIPVIEQSNMYVQCCNGTPCTDTYYTIEDNTCHLVLCEQSGGIINENQCTYDGANITNGTVI